MHETHIFELKMNPKKFFKDLPTLIYSGPLQETNNYFSRPKYIDCGNVRSTFDFVTLLQYLPIYLTPHEVNLLFKHKNIGFRQIFVKKSVKATLRHPNLSEPSTMSPSCMTGISYIPTGKVRPLLLDCL